MGDRTGTDLRSDGLRRVGRSTVFVLLAVSVAFAQDRAPVAPASPKPDAMAAEVEAIHSLGAGKTAKDAIDKFFAGHVGDPRVLGYLPSLESDLRKCLFRLSGPQPSSLQLLGRGATKYDAAASRAEFKATALTKAAGWEDAGDDIRFFDALFEGDVTVELTPETAAATTVLVGFDCESRGGYAIVPVADGEYHALIVLKLDPDAGEPVRLGQGATIMPTVRARCYRYIVSKSKLTVETKYPDGTHWSRSFDDCAFQRGFVAVQGPAQFDANGLTISGKLDAAYVKRQVAEAESRRFREWRKAKWNRDAALPEWAVALEKGAGSWAESLPAGCPMEFRQDFVDLQRAAFGPTYRKPAFKPVTGLSGPTADWQDALYAYSERRHADVEASARLVMAAEPGFAPAYALAGRALLARGDDAAAVPLFEASRKLDTKFAPAYDGLALAAFQTGDNARMQSVLSEEAAAGVSSGLTSELRAVLLRIQRGPDWKKRFDSFSTNYVVSGDTSITVCNDVAKTLEECVDVYGRQFRKRTKKTRARVRVFSGFDSYADYVSDLGGDPTNTLGVYMSNMRELCVYLHENRPELSNTIRHEGFHQYLHDFVDDVPIWFDEGYAEYFGFSRRKQGKAVVGQVGEEQVALAKALRPKFTPLPKLFLMAPEEFMANAEVHYVESWAVIHLLRDPSEARLKGVLTRYFDALLAGRSQKEAYDSVLVPVMDCIEAAFVSHVASLSAK